MFGLLNYLSTALTENAHMLVCILHALPSQIVLIFHSEFSPNSISLAQHIGVHRISTFCWADASNATREIVPLWAIMQHYQRFNHSIHRKMR